MGWAGGRELTDQGGAEGEAAESGEEEADRGWDSGDLSGFAWRVGMEAVWAGGVEAGFDPLEVGDDIDHMGVAVSPFAGHGPFRDLGEVE